MKVNKWNVGKMTSDIYEDFEVRKSTFRRLKTEKKIIDFVKKHDLNEKNFVNETSSKEPLGSEFLRRIYNEDDPLTLTIKSHIFIENFMNEIIKQKFRYSELILNPKGGRFSFYLKLNLLRSKNYLDVKMYSDILSLSKLRNKFAHDIFYDISEIKMENFYYCDDLYEGLELKSEEAKRIFNTHILKTVLYIRLCCNPLK